MDSSADEESRDIEISEMKSGRKSALLRLCFKYVEQRIDKIDAAIHDLKDALNLETKCSMGDKYETGRAMLHLEFEKLSGQRLEFQKLRKTLRMISGRPSDIIGLGSIVMTLEKNFFISIPAGEIQYEGEKYFAVGANAPIARVLTGKTAGDSIVFLGRNLEIKKVL